MTRFFVLFRLEDNILTFLLKISAKVCVHYMDMYIY